MKTRAMAFAVTLAGLGLAASTPALARGPHGGGHVHFGVFVGAPLFWGYPWYYPPPPYAYAPAYYPAPVYVQSSPPVYVEREAAQAEAPAQSWWYYCAESRSYYPYVKTCPAGWQRVSPTPPQTGGQP